MMRSSNMPASLAAAFPDCHPNRAPEERLGALGLRHRRVLAKVLVPGLDRAVELEGQRLAAAVHGLARLDADPAFGDAILLDVGPHDTLEADADAALEPVGVEVRAR